MSTTGTTVSGPTDEEILEHVFSKILRRPKLFDALTAAGIMEIGDLLSLSSLECASLHYPAEKGKPPKALMNSSDLLIYITSAKIGSGDWRGSTEGFITHWQNQFRLYERLCEPGERFSEGQKTTMLQNAVHSIDQLAAVKHNAELERTKTGVSLSYDQYCSLLVSAAVTYDRTHIAKRPDRRNVFYHDTDDPYDEGITTDDYNDDTPVSLIAFNAAQQRLRRPFTGSRQSTGSRPLTGRPDRVMMAKPRCAAITQEARDIWDKLPDRDKAIILGYSDDKLPVHQRPPDQRPPSQRVNLHEMSVYDYLQAHLHELLGDADDTGELPTDTATEITTDSPDVSDDTQLFDNVLVNALATGKKLSPGDIRRLMSSSLAKKKNASKVKFQVNSHVIYRADVHASSLAKHSLVDRGANGGVAGSDVRVIHRTDRKVDIQGIDNHMINDVYIGTAGGVIATNKGPVILVLHQYALLSKGRTIHAPGQLEWYGNDVNDKLCKVKGGLQRILTHNGYVIPIVFDRGLPRIRIRPFTDDEWDKFPHIVMTDELEWDPSVLDFDPEEHEDWFDTIASVESDPTVNLFDEFGDYRHRVIVQCTDYFSRADDDTIDHKVDRCLYHAHYLDLQYEDVDVDTGMFFLDSYEHEQSVIDVPPTPRTTTTREPDYSALRPLFGWIEPDIIKKTLEHSTQLARIPMGTMLKRAFKSNNPALNVHRRSEPVACDIVYSDTPAIDDGSTSAVLFVGLQSKVTDVYGIKSDKQFVNTLEDNIRERGAPTKLISDRAQVEISEKVEGILRSLFIGSWQSEPHQQQQNPAERRYQTIKNRTDVVLDRSGAPAYMWLLALQYVCFLLNHCYDSSIGAIPLSLHSGTTIDTSILLRFHFYQKVYYQLEETDFPSGSKEALGYMAGFSEHVGHPMCYKILTIDTLKILHRSSIRPCTDDDANRRIVLPDGEDDQSSSPSPVVQSIRDRGLGVQQDEPSGEQPATVDPPAIDPEDLIGRTFLLDPQADGTIPRARIAELIQDHESSLDDNPTRIKFRCEVGRDKEDEIIAYYDLLNYLLRDEQSPPVLWKFKRIVPTSTLIVVAPTTVGERGDYR